MPLATIRLARSGARRALPLGLVEGLDNPHFRRDPSTLRALMAAVGIDRYDVYVDDWAGRPRQFLRFEK